MLTAVGAAATPAEGLEGLEGLGWSDHLRVMDAVAAATRDPFPAALALWDRAFVALWTGEADRSEAPATALVALGNRHDNPSMRSMGLLSLGRVALAFGDVAKARALLQQAHGAAEAARNTLVLDQTRRELANLPTAADGRAAALANLRVVIRNCAESGNVSEQLQTALSIARHLVELDALVPAAVALRVMERTLLGESKAYAELRAEVLGRLTAAQGDEAGRSGSRMPLAELADYLVSVVDDLAEAYADDADPTGADVGADPTGEDQAGTSKSE
jgi:hypothetical protein